MTPRFGGLRMRLLVQLAVALIVGLVVWRAAPRIFGGSAAQDGLAALQAHDVARARALFNRSIAANLHDPSTYTLVCEACAAFGNWNLAAEYASRGVAACAHASSTDRARLYVLLADALSETEKERPQKQALDAARIALALDPGNPVVLNLAGYVMADNNVDLDLAQSLISRALQKAVRDPSGEDPLAEVDVASVEDSMGWVFYRRKLYNQAVNAMEQAISDNPEGVPNDVLKVEYYHLGAALRAAKREEEAKEAIRQSLAYDPDYGPAKIEMGLLRESPTEEIRPGRAAAPPLHPPSPVMRLPETPI